MNQKQKPGRKDPNGRGKVSNGSETGFDSWLEAKLRTAYSSVLDEPIPEDLIQLLSEKLKD